MCTWVDSGLQIVLIVTQGSVRDPVFPISLLLMLKVHTLFANISKSVKEKEEEILSEIDRSCCRHIRYMEFEKYRLIQMKRNRNGSFLSSNGLLDNDRFAVL